MTAEEARRLALTLPEAVEQDHHGRPSFRVAGKIFATIWDEQTLNVMVDQPGIRTAVDEHPDWCSERYWGKRLAAVAVDLPRAPERKLRDLLTDAWERKAGRPAA
ncbi:MAG: MmcQ/YjbR family DNA-binding protein [Actinomycetota bacterium]|nr:MmcQ/YjbR family DNA-binding protein [Actinomycetota bacterium]